MTGRTIDHSGRDEFKTTAKEKAIGSKRSADALERAQELLERERAWEAMMDERIRTESALIRFENDERKRLIEDGPQNPPPSFRVTKQIRRTGKAIDFDR